MGKLSIARLAFAVLISATFLIPPTQSFAAKSWLEKLFAPPHHKVQKRRKSRPAASSAKPAEKFRLPDTAPIPEPGPRTTVTVSEPSEPAAAAPETKPLPKPEAKPAETSETFAGEQPENAPASPPIPEFRPDRPDPGAAGAQIALPAGPPTPEFKPEKPAPAEPKADQPEEPPRPPDPRSALRPDASGELPPEEVACRQRLSALGVKFDTRPAASDPSGCSVPYPLDIRSLGNDIDIQPDAEMNCAMAEAAARFAKEVISPAAEAIFGEKLTSISHASAYVCRPRAGTGILSEHAFGNALDIASFTLSKGTIVAIEPTPPERNGRLVSRVREAACGPFKTVLGPGAPDHSEHLHFDLAPRRNGGTVCE